jgi:hypothetical protein
MRLKVLKEASSQPVLVRSTLTTIKRIKPFNL